jgi:zinc protease
MKHAFVLAGAMALALGCTQLAGAQSATAATPAASKAAAGAPKAAAARASLTKLTEVEGITEYRLPNGLQVLLVPDDSKPSTTVNLTYRVGSRFENYGETGMAHLLEHLMFKGTPRNPNVWAEFTRRGLRANGSTWFDRTNYFASFAANEDNLRWFLSWHADAMVNSFIARKDLDSEMTVVRNEMEMGENDPGRILFEKTLASMYQWHNYGKDTIGARSDVENVDISRLQAFYRLYYQPDNATLIIAGKFDPQKTLSWVQEYFGPIPKPRRTLPHFYTIDPVQDGERAVTLRRVGGTPLLYSAYHVPGAADPDYAAVEALSLVMADVPAGRLHKRLTEKNLAASVGAFGEGLHDPGFTLFTAQLAPGQDPEKARAEMIATLESIDKEPITQAELDRAKTKWLKDWEQEFTNPETVGVALSESVAQGDWRLFFLVRDRVRALKLADLQRVAEQNLLPSNRTFAQYVPTESPRRAPTPRDVDVAAQFKDFKPQAAAAAVAAFDATPANIDALTQRFELASGMKVALLPKPTRGEAVSALLILHYGDEKSLAGQGTVASMTGALLDKGSASLDRQQIQDKLDELKTEMSISGDATALTVSLRSRRDTLPQAIALVGELLRRPSFPSAVMEEQRTQSLAAIERARKEPEAVVANAIARHGNPYPRGDVRYARTFDEIESDLKGVTLEQVRAFHAKFYGASYAEFGASGDLDAAAVRRALESAFGDWRSQASFTRVPNPPVAVPPLRELLSTPDKQNATMQTQQTFGLTDTDPDYPALLVANHMVGGGGNSRLWKRIREKEGLSYGVYSFVQWNNFEPNSTWVSEAIFAPQNRGKVESAFNEVLASTLKDGFTSAELDEAKQGLINARRLQRAQDERLAGALAYNLYLKRDFSLAQRVDSAIQALTLDQVNAAARKYLKPAQFVTVYGGDFKGNN